MAVRIKKKGKKKKEQQKPKRPSFFKKFLRGRIKKAPAAKPAAPRRRRRRRGRQTLNYLFFGLVGFIILCILCYFVFFKVYKITVSGDLGKYTEAEIIEASGIEKKDSLFKIDERRVYAQMVSMLPYIETVEVDKKFPTTVALKVTVSKPIGAIESGGKYLYINSSGKVLENEMTDYDKQYPLITGITPTSTELGSYVLNQNSEQLLMLQELQQALDATGMDGITLISVGNRLNMRILVDDRILVELGTESDLDYKIEFVQKTIEQNMDSTTKGVLDVTLLEKLSRGFFREERDLQSLIEEEIQKDEQTASGEDGASGGSSGITVDPETGAIIVGPHDPLNPDASSSQSTSSEGSENTSDNTGSSSDGAGSSSSGSSSEAGRTSSAASSFASSSSSSSSSSSDSSKEESSSSSEKE